MKYDVVIVGSGIAGLYCALHLPKTLRVLILCKGDPQECNTYYAQGGVSVALDFEDVALHIEDTLSAGAYLNDVNAVRFLSEKSLQIIQDLEQFGIKVDQNARGEILYAQEGGHQKARIIHFDGDGSGKFIHTSLLRHLPHLLWSNACVVDLIIEKDRCLGVLIEREGEIFPVFANHIVLASGGIGGLYQFHTNASSVGGELHGVILKKGLKLQDMEMMQFHPTVYTQAPMERKPLISEAVRGEGGKVIDEEGRRFLFDYDSRGELAPRDIVARGIFEHCFKNQKQVFLDLSAFQEGAFQERFPNIFQTFQDLGINPPYLQIPISPAFHYAMGGIGVDLKGRVWEMKNLYAIGECANNRVHGANRLASNSLLEGFIFGKCVAKEICQSEFRISPQEIKKCENAYLRDMKSLTLECENDLIKQEQLRKMMWENVGIIRTQNGLKDALEIIEAMQNENIGWMLDLRLKVAREIVIQALKREKSLGAHFLKDDV